MRFWRLVPDQPREGCWLWTGTPAGGRYGNFKTGRGRESTTAHRFAWELTYGPIPIGMFVCHRCDTPKCVRPDHLFLGTARENTRDMLEKGRHGNQWKTGVNR